MPTYHRGQRGPRRCSPWGRRPSWGAFWIGDVWFLVTWLLEYRSRSGKYRDVLVVVVVDEWRARAVGHGRNFSKKVCGLHSKPYPTQVVQTAISTKEEKKRSCRCSSPPTPSPTAKLTDINQPTSQQWVPRMSSLLEPTIMGTEPGLECFADCSWSSRWAVGSL